jgi:hypothetical protein
MFGGRPSRKALPDSCTATADKMKRWNQRLLAAASAWLGLFAVAATATPIAFDFSVTAIGGPLNGTTANGSFTFDSSSIPATLPSVLLQAGLLTALDFSWDSIAYTAVTANTGALEFDAAGDLVAARFGTNCDVFFFFCTLPQNTESWAVSNVGGTGVFVYQTSTSDISFGTFTLSRASAPEPGTLTLLGLGLAGLGFSRRGRKQ